MHVLEAVAVRQHPSEVVWLVEALVGSAWWERRYFDEEAVGRAVSRCLVGRRARRELAPETVLQFYDIFAARRNPDGRTTHCGGTPDGQEHTEDCGGFCADNEMAARAWSLHALTKALGTSGGRHIRYALASSLSSGSMGLTCGTSPRSPDTRR